VKADAPKVADDARAAAWANALTLRAEFAATAAEVDRQGKTPHSNLARIHELGLTRLLVPAEMGGIASRPGLAADLELLTEILTELSAGESSTAQIWGVHVVVSRLIFGNLLEVDAGTQRRLLREMLDEGVRFSNASAEGGKQRRDFKTTASAAEGGFKINGTKLFNTGSDGARYTIAPVLLEGFKSVEEGGLTYMLIAMDSSGVKPHNDWDNMGQRATASGAITFTDVFVPKAFHMPIRGGAAAFFGPTSTFGLLFQLAINADILGMGYGAFDAILDAIRNYARPNLPTIERPAEDPLNRWHVGRLSALLAAARALQREASRMISEVELGRADRSAASAQMMRAKYLTNEAVLEVTGQLHRLAGGRATSNKYRLDRFWRNARTLTTHDSIDAKLQQIGAYEIDQVAPPATMIS
jgi:alkylation response protein AidB-like acyl-CoA dehydrogenase